MTRPENLHCYVCGCRISEQARVVWLGNDLWRHFRCDPFGKPHCQTERRARSFVQKAAAGQQVAQAAITGASGAAAPLEAPDALDTLTGEGRR